MSQAAKAGLPRVVILIGAMWPGNDSSGPNRSVQGLCEALSDKFDFRLIARSGAPGEQASAPPGWIDCGFARILYLSQGPLGAKGLIPAIRDCNARALMMNSVWDREFTLPALAARRVGLLPRLPAVISTRGEFSEEALALKPRRKEAMRRVLRQSGALAGITLHATSSVERDDVQRAFPGVPTFVAANVRPVPAALPHVPAESPTLRCVFLGRISPVKGLDIALQALKQCAAPIAFSIYGPQEDRAYFEQCRAIAASLPHNIDVRWSGTAKASQIPGILSSSDLLLMPSHSENFGHAIFEALAAGVPVLIGPNTPWQDLKEAGAGAVLPLGDSQAWARTIEAFARGLVGHRQQWSAGARAVAENYVEQSAAAKRWEIALRLLTAGRAPTDPG